jgi:hypothetical protein
MRRLTWEREGGWVGHQNALFEICQWSCGVVDDEAHMVWGCQALVDQRVQHSELLEDSNITSVADFMQQDAGNWQPFCGVVMINAQSWRGVHPTGIEWNHSVSGE